MDTSSYQAELCDDLYLFLLGERRIRVHTLCLPVVNSLADVYAGADVQAVVCLLANMGEFQISFHVFSFKVANEAWLFIFLFVFVCFKKKKKKWGWGVLLTSPLCVSFPCFQSATARLRILAYSLHMGHKWMFHRWISACECYGSVQDFSVCNVVY